MFRPALRSWSCNFCSDLLTYHEQIPVILAVDFTVVANRKRSVCSAQSFQQENSLLPLRKGPVMSLRNGLDASVFAGDIDQPVDIDHRRIDTPLIAIGMILVVGSVLERPFRLEISIQLGNIIWAIRHRSTNRIIVGAVCGRRIVVVLDHDRIRPTMLIHGCGRVPTEAIRVDEIPLRVEMKEMSAAVVVIINGAEENRAIG